MDKLTFKYDILYILKDRCEFKRFKRKSFFQTLSDIYISRGGLGLLLLSFMILGVYLITNLIIPVPLMFVYSMTGPLCLSIFSLIITYYEQHKNVTILISDILKLNISKNKKTLQVEYKDSKRIRIKTVDMPDADNARQDIIDQLSEMQLNEKRKTKNSKDNEDN